MQPNEQESLSVNDAYPINRVIYALYIALGDLPIATLELNVFQSRIFLDAYAKFLSLAVRVVAAGGGIVGVVFVLSAAIFPDFRPWGFVAGVLGIAICVAAYVARPIRGDDLARMQEDSLGRSHVSELRSKRRQSGEKL